MKSNTLKSILTIAMVMIISAGQAVHSKQINLLWLGNSFTGGTILQKYVKGMINAGNYGDTVILSDANILWGQNLDDHWNNTTSRNMIKSRKYSHVILQGYINMGDLGRETQRVNCIKYGMLLADEIRANNAIPIIFCAHANANSTPTQWEYVTSSYKLLADTSHSTFAPASLSWLEAQKQIPGIYLWNGDGHHQNELSNYLNMSVFSYILTGKSPVGNPYRLSNLDAAEKTIANDMAPRLQQCAAVVVERQNGTAVPLSGIAMAPSTAQVMTGETFSLSITYSPANATNRNVIWSSGNTAVATVNSLGVMTGVSVDSVVITARSTEGNFTATATITVVPSTVIRVTNVALDRQTAALKVGVSLTLVPTITPATATNKKTTWLSSNYVAASVDSTGKVTGLAVGVTRITATTVDGAKAAVCTVTVTAAVAVRETIRPMERIASGDDTRPVEVYTASGMLVFKGKPVSQDHYAGLPKGIYYLRMKGDGYTSGTKSIFIR